MATLPKATVSVDETAGLPSSGSDLICVMCPVADNDDLVPRVFGNPTALYEFHGYSEGLEYSALHYNRTRKNVLFVGMPIDTPGVVSNEVIAGNTGTSVITISEGANGVLAQHNGVLTVIKGGIIGTDQIKLGLSLDGGRTVKTVRLGTGNSYVDPYVGISFAFAAGTLVTGDVAHTWDGSAPLPAVADYQVARANLAAQAKLHRSILLCPDLPSETEGLAFLAMLEDYETLDQRAIFGRASVLDVGEHATLASMAAHIAAREDDYEGVNGPSLRLSIGRGRILSPFSGWFARRPASWFASLREYQHDLHIPTWRKSDGPIGATLTDDDGKLVELDDRVNGEAASLARFVSLRTWANDTRGPFIAIDPTRDTEGTLRAYSQNDAVVRFAVNLVQRLTEDVAIGQSLVLNSDGTATADSLKVVEAPVNAALQNQLLTNLSGEGQRASGAVWSADPSTLYNVAEPIMVGTLELLLNGTVHSVVTTVRIQRGA